MYISYLSIMSFHEQLIRFCILLSCFLLISGVQPPAPASIANVRLISSGPAASPSHSAQPLASSLATAAPICSVLPAASAAFQLSSSFQPVPAKMVAKIRSLQYVDMRELLPDNVSLLKNMEELDAKFVSASLPATARPKLREVHSLLTWASCFTLYVAILAESHPHVVQQRLAYMALIVREARRNGGEGWRSYDTIFRQNAASNPALDWSILDSALYSSTFLVQRSQSGIFCHHCFCSDHSSKDCALQPFAEERKGQFFRQSSRASTHAGITAIPICLSWNKGKCIKGAACKYRHSCATCPGSHQACNCPEAQPTSIFKRFPSSVSAGSKSANWTQYLAQRVEVYRDEETYS